MSLETLRELYKIPSDPSDDSDGDEQYTTAVLSSTFSFSHDGDGTQYYRQMLNTPAFQQILEQEMTKAFAASVSQFKQRHDNSMGSRAHHWSDDYEGEVKVQHITTRGQY